ncbi:MAG: SDR family NAD(P)-dependent oxidoreductase [Jatrophihabitans sp.]|uniref:SDR family NAD(P)-dependent oxidoreductase n=1 Tax=Jatrophihabitans sp. TaxID=1932789 RepID=UPI003F7E1353
MSVFAGQVALVTGASRGIGRAIAQQFAAAGASVVVHYGSDGAAAEQTLGSLASGDHLAAQAELGEPAAVDALVTRVVERFGRLDVLVNNAGVYLDHPILGTSYDEWQQAWRRTLATNLLGPVNLAHRVAPVMVAQGGGRIVNVTSRGAYRGEPEHTAYGASKAALNSFGQSLAQELAPHGVLVTTVAPGFVETDMAAPYLEGAAGEAIRAQSPLRRVATPDEVARIVVFLATPGTEYMTGAIVDINGASYLRS